MQVGIKSGDTLSALAQQHGTTVDAIVKANGGKVKDANLIYAGDTLNIPGKSDGFSPSGGSPRGMSGPGGDSFQPGGATGTNGASAPTGPVPQGQVGDWIKQAMGELQKAGVPVDKMNPQDIALIIQRESGGNPNAQNGWDSNAAKGTPSIGLMQTIQPTFDSYKLPGHGDIRNPVDNIIAGVRYAVARYGSVSNVPGVKAVHNGGAYVGY